MTKPTILLVLGMHRSGTSAVSGAMSCYGFEHSDSLLPPQEGVNDKGFFEDSEIVGIHEKIFGCLNRTWDDPRPMPNLWWEHKKLNSYIFELSDLIKKNLGCKSNWIIKDPRMCLLLPLWRSLFKQYNVDVRALICVRHPSEVSESLFKRDQIVVDKSCALYNLYLASAIKETSYLRRFIVCYDQLLADPDALLDKAYTELGLDKVSGLAKKSRASDFVDVSLKRNNSSEQKKFGETQVQKLALDNYSMLSHASFSSISTYVDKSQVIGYFDSHISDMAKYYWAALNFQAEIQKNSSEQIQYRELLVAEYKEREKQALLKLESKSEAYNKLNGMYHNALEAFDEYFDAYTQSSKNYNSLLNEYNVVSVENNELKTITNSILLTFKRLVKLLWKRIAK